MRSEHDAYDSRDANESFDESDDSVWVYHASNERVQRPSQSHRRSRHVKTTIMRWRTIGALSWAAIMLLGGLVGLLFFARPTSSAVEMRNLTEFPQLSVESFLDGSFFTDVSLWYADTYPLRDPMISADHGIDGLFGVAVDVARVGGNVQADEIPVEEDEPMRVIELADPPEEQVVAADIQDNIMEDIYIEDGAGYSIYYFDQLSADTYITAMNTAAEKLDGTATVYSILSPANLIMLDPETAKMLGGSDQQQTLKYLDTRFDPRVKSVEIVDDIIQHRDEYLYFYSDHHWTQYGAYYAYAAFCKEKGIVPLPLEARRMISYGEFMGSYYETISSTGWARTDTIDAFVPNGTNELTCWSDGEETQGAVVDEGAADWNPFDKGSGFIMGDQPLEIIHNPQINDGSSCLIVKDSYGCAFAPLLVDNYEYLHIIDFRYTDENICDYAKKNNIQDVIFINGIKIALTQSVAATLLAEVS